MLVKRYVVKEMPEAMAMIRDELGRDAVILSTKKVQSRGFLGMFAKTHIEVIAAANEEQKPPERQVASVGRNAAAGAYRQSSVQQAAPQAVPSNAPAMAPVAVAEPHPQRDAQVPAVPVPIAPLPVERPVLTRFDDMLRQAETAQEQVPAPAPAPASVASPAVAVAETPGADNEAVLKEVQELRQLLRSVLHSSTSQVLPESILQVRQQLLSNDVEVERVDELIERGIRHFQQLQGVNQQEFRGILLNFIKEQLEEVAEPSPLAVTTRVAAFIGPTGVGKTTTIAKLAAEQVLTLGKRIGLITTDTYRIAAVEQLRTYANILNVPLEVCYSPDDIKRALDKFADLDLIMVDTAGRNYGNELNVKELNSYLQAIKPQETYLVLSLTTKASDLKQIVDNFTQVNVDRFLFTKVDETSSYGALYNLVVDRKIPLSYVTTGQNVPDDIELASVDRLASLIVGEKTHA